MKNEEDKENIKKETQEEFFFESVNLIYGGLQIELSSRLVSVVDLCHLSLELKRELLEGKNKRRTPEGIG